MTELPKIDELVEGTKKWEPSWNLSEEVPDHVKLFREARRRAREELELRRLSGMVSSPSEGVRYPTGFEPKFFDFLIGSVFLPGIAMLAWIPFLFLLSNLFVFLSPFRLSTFLVGLGSFVTSFGVHELGHLAVARYLRVTIEEWRLVPFGIGFRISERIDSTTSFRIIAAGPLANLAVCLPCSFFWQKSLAFFLLISSNFLFLINALPHWHSDGFKVALNLTNSSRSFTYLYAASYFIFIPISIVLLLSIF